SVEGRWVLARLILMRYWIRSRADISLSLASVLRESGKPFRALLTVLVGGLLSRSMEVDRRLVASECLIDLCRISQYHWLWQTKPARRLWAWLIGSQVNAVRRHFDVRLDPSMETRLQNVGLSCAVRCLDADELPAGLASGLLQIVANEM